MEFLSRLTRERSLFCANDVHTVNGNLLPGLGRPTFLSDSEQWSWPATPLSIKLPFTRAYKRGSRRQVSRQAPRASHAGVCRVPGLLSFAWFWSLFAFKSWTPVQLLPGGFSRADTVVWGAFCRVSFSFQHAHAHLFPQRGAKVQAAM